MKSSDSIRVLCMGNVSGVEQGSLEKQGGQKSNFKDDTALPTNISNNKNCKVCL